MNYANSWHAHEGNLRCGFTTNRKTVEVKKKKTEQLPFDSRVFFKDNMKNTE